MTRPSRRRPKKIQRIRLPRRKVLLLLSVIAALGVFLIFLTTIFAPLRELPALPEDPPPQDTAAPEASRNSASGQQELPGKELCPPPKETPPAKKPEPPEALSPSKAPPAKKPEPPEALSPSKAPPAKKPEPSEALSPPQPSAPEKTLIFVIDDAGHNIRQLEPFLALPFPVSIAVLPGLEYSVPAADKIRAAGKELLLHQPMQAQNPDFDPGPGAVTGNTETAEIGDILEKNLNEIGTAAGMNNHEGSLITADAAAMKEVLEFCRQKGIFFLDSRTTAQSAAAGEAEKLGIHIWERTVFLDNSQERSSIIGAIYEGMKAADKKGSAILIGHVWSDDLAQILQDMYPELVEQGYTLSSITRMVLAGNNDEYPWN